MRLLLALCCLVLMTPMLSASLASARWDKRSVRVIDRTSPALAGIIAETVADYSALPGPRLVYERGPVAPECVGAERVQGAIVVCDRTSDPANCHIPFDGGCTFLRSTKRGVLRSAIVHLRLNNPDAVWAESMAAHELGHALGLAHNSAADSCMWQARPDPGKADARTLRRLYRHGKDR